jgi:tRNA U34 2-thiouridine synthase MnmA/TrmU
MRYNMAIIKEFYIEREDGVTLYRNYSDKGLKIKKVGTEEVYSEAIDIENAPYIYEETEEIEKEILANI